MEIRSGLSRVCHAAGQALERFAFMPGSADEAAVCAALGALGAASMVAVPAVMSALKLGGAW